MLTYPSSSFDPWTSIEHNSISSDISINFITPFDEYDLQLAHSPHTCDYECDYYDDGHVVSLCISSQSSYGLMVVTSMPCFLISLCSSMISGMSRLTVVDV